MVRRNTSRGATVLAVLALVAAVPDALAAVEASIDRSTVELNESFTYKLTTDGDIDAQPDVSVLEADFYVGQGSQLSNTTIVNGQIRRSKTWTFALMPRRAGEIEIPPVSIGSEKSNPVTVTVREPTYEPPGEAEVFITSEVDFEETYVQAQVLLTIKIYRSVATRQPSLRDPTLTGVETLIELAGDDRSYEAIIDGTAYSVVERVFALYPQESGEISLSPARFEARILRNGRITGRRVYDSEPITITVKPVPVPPPEFANADWLPARDLELTETWSDDTARVAAGVPLTRKVTISALGQLETQIPAVEPPSAPGINVYPDKPELSRRLEDGGIRGIRRDQYALIGVSGGEVTLPALEVPWWNVETGEWRVARLPERVIEILPTGDPAPPDPEPVPAAGSVTVTDALPATPARTDLWRRIAELLAALWLLTLAGWWWSSRPRRRPAAAPEVPLHKRQARFLKTARKAALAGDAAGVRAALLDWAALEWPGTAPRSIGQLAGRVSAPLAAELEALSAASYGPGDRDWDGKALAKALRSFAVVEEREGAGNDVLPLLNPVGQGR